MPAQGKSLLDSFALVAFLQKEHGFERVRALLRAARTSGQPLLMNEINIGEVYYITARRRSREKAEEVLRHLETLPIQPVSNSWADVMEAARIKARFPISYADAFAVATAMRVKATVVTGDTEFRAVADLVQIDWL